METQLLTALLAHVGCDGSGLLSSHTPKFNLSPRGPAKQSLVKDWKIGAVVQWAGTALQPCYNNRKHMWWAVGREQQVCSRPGTSIPEPRPHLTLRVSTDTSLSVTRGQRSDRALLSSATGCRPACLHWDTGRGMEGMSRMGWYIVSVLSMAWVLCGLVMLT